MNAELVIVDCQDRRLRGEIILDDHSYLVEVGRYCNFTVENTEFLFYFIKTFNKAMYVLHIPLRFYSSLLKMITLSTPVFIWLVCIFFLFCFLFDVLSHMELSVVRNWRKSYVSFSVPGVCYWSLTKMPLFRKGKWNDLDEYKLIVISWVTV